MEMEKVTYSEKLDTVKIEKCKFPELEIVTTRFSGTEQTGEFAYWVEIEIGLPVPKPISEIIGRTSITKTIVVICEKESETLEVIKDVISL